MKALPSVARHGCIAAISACCAVIGAPAYTKGGVDQDRPAQAERRVPLQLTPGAILDDGLAGGEHGTFVAWADPGQFVQVRVEQQGIDVDLTVRGPDGGEIARIDRPNGIFGPEVISWIADAPGWYELRIQSAERHALRGDFTVMLQAPRAAGPADRLRLEAETTTGMAERQRATGTAASVEQAIVSFDRATKLWQELDQPYEQAIAFYGLGWSQNALCRYEDAADSFDRASRIMEVLVDPHGQAISLTGSAYAYMYLSDTARALERFERALDLRRLTRNRRGEAMALYGIGAVESLNGDQDRALSHFFESLELRKQVDDRLGMAVTLIGIGKAYRHEGRNREALYHLNQALDLFRQLENAAGIADALANSGWVHYELGEFDDAFEYFQKALTLCRELGDPGGEAMTLYGLARAESRKGSLIDAQHDIANALDIVEVLRTRVSNDRLRAAYFASVQDYFDFNVELLMRLHAQQPAGGFERAAFDVSERARARELLDRLADAHADVVEGLDPGLLARERTVRLELNATMDYHLRQLGKPTARAEIDAVNAKLATLQNTYEEARAAIRRASPRWAALHERPAHAADIQTLLGRDAILLDYAFSQDACYLWTLTGDSITGIALPVAAGAIRDSANRLVRQLTAEGGSTRTFELNALALSRMILPPAVAAAMNGKRAIVVVTNGALQSVPFNALSLASGSEPYTPLLVDHDVVNLPSASTLTTLRKESAGRTNRPLESIAIFADPVFFESDDRITHTDARRAAAAGGSSDGSGRPDASDHVSTSAGGLRRLPGTRREAETTRKIAPVSKTFLDFDANLDAAMAPDLSDYQIVHFATHGIVPEDHPEQAAVVLSLVTPSGALREGYLRLPLVYNLRLPVELVVLSACDTSLGREIAGEGLVGLTRGFMSAGSRRVVATLWKVRDGATEEMMRRFYGAIFDGHMRPAAALRAAAAGMWRERRWAPSDWSAFVFFGEWQ
jgi:CHAT domain-containing protein/tetratricopeptide (TPR) repeat protein